MNESFWTFSPVKHNDFMKAKKYVQNSLKTPFSKTVKYTITAGIINRKFESGRFRTTYINL